MFTYSAPSVSFALAFGRICSTVGSFCDAMQDLITWQKGRVAAFVTHHDENQAGSAEKVHRVS